MQRKDISLLLVVGAIGLATVGCRSHSSSGTPNFFGDNGGGVRPNDPLVSNPKPINPGDHNADPVPEPASALILGAGALGYAGYRKLRSRFKKP